MVLTVESFGFRGEALSSLCAMSESVGVITATEDEAPFATALKMDRNGNMTDSEGKVARKVC